jgi:hypothetical protein
LAILASLLASAADRELTGRVVDANTGEPIARAHVTLRFFQGGQPAPEVTLLSDTDGGFRITDLPAGGYQVSCEKAGYLPASQTMGAMAVNSTDGKSASTVVMKLISQAVLEGTVVDDRDTPAESTFIQLVRQGVVNGRRQLQTTGGGSTDEAGYFRIYGLPAGRYYISIAARLSGARRAKPLAYPQLYYPNTTDIAAAQPIDLKAGDEQQIKIRLPEPVPAFEVRGVVATAAPNASVSLVRQGSGSMFQPSDGESTWDGQTKTFRITHVTPGIYLLTAMAQDGRSSAFAGTTITVGNADVTGIRLEPADTGLDGTVRVEGDTGQQRVSGYVSLQSERLGNGAQVDADGKFHVPNLSPETYRIVPQMYGPQSQVCVRSILQGGRDVRDGVTIAAGVAPEPVEIVFSSHCGSIDVALAPSDSPVPPNLTASLLRKAGDELVLEKQGYQGPRSGDGTAHFAIQGVAPGDYVVYVWPQDAQIEYANAEYMRQFESYSQAVTVTEDSKASVTVDKLLVIPAKN